MTICADYSSSQKTPLSVYISYAEGQSAFGYGREILSAGAFKICYKLIDLTNEWNESDLADKYPSPVQDGQIEKGKYVIIFEQGRDRLLELPFEVLSN